MSDYELPSVDFTAEELEYLQNLLNREREYAFDYLIDIEEEGAPETVIQWARDKWRFAQALRDKVYHLNGRDTLAPGKHEQRWWDQRHGY